MLSSLDSGSHEWAPAGTSPEADLAAHIVTGTDVSEADTPVERRLHKRFKAAFRASCLLVDGRAHMAMIKNMSRSGVMVELEHPLREGDIVHYFWDERRIASARVAWSDGRYHGLDNHEEQPIFDKEFNYRSVRVPCNGEAELWVDGALHRPNLVNLSLGGAQLEGLRVRVGALVTLRFNGVELTNACVRWSHGASPAKPARTGLAFSRRMSASQLSAILYARGVELAA